MSEIRALLVAIAVVALADVGARWVFAPPTPTELPTLAGFAVGDANHVELGRVDEPIVLEREDGAWHLTAPLKADADPTEVDALLAALAGGVRPEAQVADGGDLAPYGLANGTELRVDVSGAGPLASLIVGADAGDGGTFVRLPDDPRVFRARIGGRARYDRPARSLVDRRVAPCDPAVVTRVALGDRVATKTADGWSGLDGDAVTQLVASLCTLRGDVAEPSRVSDWSLGAVTLDRTDGEPITVRLGQSGALRYVGNGERAWAVPGLWVDRVADPATFADRALWTLQRVDRVELHGPGRDGDLVRDGASWALRRPTNVDLDPARADAVATWLRHPRVLRWDPSAAGALTDRLVVHGETTETLWLGDTAGEVTTVRAGGATGVIDSRVARGLLGLFGS